MLALSGLLPAAATGQPPTTETIHERFDTTEFDTVCSGAVVPIPVTGRSVFHITEFDGRPLPPDGDNGRQIHYNRCRRHLHGKVH